MKRMAPVATETPFYACTAPEKLARLLELDPELAPFFVGQLDSVWWQMKGRQSSASAEPLLRRGAR